jgi:hypothetical protein
MPRAKTKESENFMLARYVPHIARNEKTASHKWKAALYGEEAARTAS